MFHLKFEKIYFLKTFLAFFTLLCPNYTRFWLKMGQKMCKKMALSKNLRKTGGLHIDFHCWGIFSVVKNTVMTTALSGNFFKGQK